MFGAILKATNSSFKKGMTFCRSIFVKKVMKLLAFIFEQPSYKGLERKHTCFSAFKIACRIMLFPYTQSNGNLLNFIRCSVPGVVLIVSISDICLLPYFLYSHEYRLTRNTVYCAILSDQIVVGCPLGVPISY